MKTIGLGIAILLLAIVVFSPLTSFGDMKAQNPRVTEKEFYNMIAIDIVISNLDIEVDDVLYVAKIDFTLDNENGKKYYPNHECGPQLFYQMTGKTGPNGSFTVCYDVEKKFNNFKMYYKKELFGNLDLKMLEQSNKIKSSPNPTADGLPCPSIAGQVQNVWKDGKCVPEDSFKNENIETPIQNPDVSKTTSLQITCGEGTELIGNVCQAIKDINNEVTIQKSSDSKVQNTEVFDKPVKESEQPSISNVGNVFSQLIEMLKSLFNFS